jgi:3-hydroxyisobutyrate dehydrogenase
VIAVANKLGVPLELGALIEDLYRQALDRYGDVDGELLGARFIAERAGVTLRR